MAKNNQKMVDAITSMDEDFAQWYTDIVKKAELSSYTSVKGCMVIRPYGYAIWEQMQHILDETFKETGHENVCMPMFIPESLLHGSHTAVRKSWKNGFVCVRHQKPCSATIMQKSCTAIGICRNCITSG